MGLRKLTSPYTSIRALATGSNGNGHHLNGHHPATNLETTAGRKADHLRINVEEDVAAKGVEPGFAAYRFVHLALPELDLADVTAATDLFGRQLGAPILISCMTGGTKEAERINLTLAEVAQSFGLPMGLGSGRVLLERPELRATFAVRRAAPDILLFCNLGAVQLNRGVGIAECQRLVEMTGADALVLHFNPLQEALQPAGDTCFGGLLPKIRALCAGLGVPVVAKEVGWGLAPDVVRALLDAGVAAIDVAGAGGTSWSEVERHRMAEPWRARVAAAFAGWGLPTAEALVAARQVAPEATIIASGGLATGLDVAKALALGADLAGLAGPFLRAAAAGPDVAADLARELIETLRVAMFCVGAGSLGQLQGTSRLVREGQPTPRLHREQLAYATPGSAQFLDITEDVAAVVARSGVRQGLVHVYSRHTTAAVRINENEPLLLADFQRLLGRLVPPGGFEHDDLARRVNVPPDEPMNGHAHARHLLLATSETIPVVDGRLDLGSWQRVFLIELCSARARQVSVQVLSA
jgi:isopentenyl-diphosphate delta-isomerase